MFHPGYEVSALLLGKGAPLWHSRAVEAAGDSIEQILVGGQGSGGSGTALEYAQLKIARLGPGGGIKPQSNLAVTIAILPVTHDAVATVIGFGILGVTGNVSDVGFRVYARLEIVLSKLRPGRQGEGYNCSAHEQRPLPQIIPLHAIPLLEIEVKADQQFTSVDVGGVKAQ